jgi:hypothetical protein
MKKSDIRSAIGRAIAEVCDRDPQWSANLADSVRPIGGIDGFDSYSAEEAIAAIGDFLEHDFPLRFNPFIAETRYRAHSIGEIVNAIYEHVAQPKRVS